MNNGSVAKCNKSVIASGQRERGNLFSDGKKRLLRHFVPRKDTKMAFCNSPIIDPVRKIKAFIVFCILGCSNGLFFAYGQPASPDEGNKDELIVFYSAGCHRCAEVKKDLMPDIEKEFSGRIKIGYRDIADIQNYKFLLGLEKRHKINIKIILPVFYFKGHFLNGDKAEKNNLKNFIAKPLNKFHKEEVLPEIDLIERFKGFSFFVIVSAGLIDGINPCAFTVIIFFISFLALQGYRKRELAVIGLSFIFAVFLTYFLIGLGVFSVLYRLKGFWLVSRIFNFSIGIFTIIIGIFALYDFFRYKKTGKTEGLLLQLPNSVKNRIHTVIGLHYRKDKKEDRQAGAVERPVFKLILSALITGFLVSLLEAVCTGQTYLPTIGFVLKTSSLKGQAFVYLLLYNFMFIAPLLVIFFLALWGVASERFSGFLKKRLLGIKILMSILFFTLGIFLIWRA